MKETLYKFLFLFSVASLLFLGGYATAWFHLGFGQFIDNGLRAGKIWVLEHQNLVSNVVDRRLSRAEVMPPVDVWDKEHALDGYTLITGQFGAQAFLIDMQGNIAHHWSLPFKSAWPKHPQIANPLPDDKISWFRAKAMPNGDLIVVYTANDDTPFGYGLAKIDKDSHLLWKYTQNAHHDFDVAPDGTIYALVQKMETQPIEGLPWLRLPMLADYVVVLSPEGKEIQRVSVLQAFNNSPYADFLHGNNMSNKGGDYTHTNTVQVLRPELAAAFPQFKPGQLLISMRMMDTIAVLDLQKKAIVWAAKGPWDAQHSAQFLKNGNILMFDNEGYYTSQKHSRILEVDPKTLAVPWSYTSEDFYNMMGGHVQRLPNGNVLVTSAMNGHAFEVTPDRHVVWSYWARRQFNDILPAMDYFLLQTALRYKASDLPFLKEKK